MRTKAILVRGLVAAAVATVVVATVAVAPATANQLYPLTGTLNTSGTLVQYSTYRPHSSGGSQLTISDNAGCSGSRWTRFGLRINNFSQYTQTLQFTGDAGAQAFRRASDGGLGLATNSYAINGRMADETGHGCDNSWAGSLEL